MQCVLARSAAPVFAHARLCAGEIGDCGGDPAKRHPPGAGYPGAGSSVVEAGYDLGGGARCCKRGVLLHQSYGDAGGHGKLGFGALGVGIAGDRPPAVPIGRSVLCRNAGAGRRGAAVAPGAPAAGRSHLYGGSGLLGVWLCEWRGSFTHGDFAPSGAAGLGTAVPG